MAHQSETDRTLEIIHVRPAHDSDLPTPPHSNSDVWLVVLPEAAEGKQHARQWGPRLAEFVQALGPDAILAVLTTPENAAGLVPDLSAVASFQLWVAVKLDAPTTTNYGSLPSHHAALVIFSKYRRSLVHTKTRIAYTYCPACDKTTKDYGGKKHTYHQYGTLISDVWRDIAWNPAGGLEAIEVRLSDLFAVQPHRSLLVCDLRDGKARGRLASSAARRQKSGSTRSSTPAASPSSSQLDSQLLLGDSRDVLRKLPADSIDFCFADPPYNIAKKYDRWDDALDLQDYFGWCDLWLDELARVLRPGCTCAVLNIPQFAVRHFAHLSQRLQFQNWIAWEGLSLPVRMIMPAHYSIVCFSKGDPRMLPTFSELARQELEREAVSTLRESYCLRQACIQVRRAAGLSDRQPLSDLWWDIHRLKHNSRRVDHPCQLPPALMHRLIAAFTYPGEVVLDPFNGAGTTTLCAAQLNRKFLGIELSQQYHRIAKERHALLARGGDPFAKDNGVPKAKNSRVKRIGGTTYAVSKKQLQLEVRAIARRLGRLPTRDEVQRHSRYPIRYFDEYFISWGEVCAAARTTGMTETRSAAAQPADRDAQCAFSFLTDAR